MIYIILPIHSLNYILDKASYKSSETGNFRSGSVPYSLQDYIPGLLTNCVIVPLYRRNG